MPSARIASSASRASARGWSRSMNRPRHRPPRATHTCDTSPSSWIVDGNAEIVQQSSAAEDGALAIDYGNHAQSWPLLQIARGLRHDSARERFSYDRARNRMQRAKTAARGHVEKRRFGFAFRRLDNGHDRRAYGNGSRFIENQRVDLGGPLQKIRALDEDAKPGGHRHRRHDSGRARRPPGPSESPPPAPRSRGRDSR